MRRSETNSVRVAMLGHKRIPSREGGIEVVVQELGTRLVKLGCEVTCYNRGGHHVGGKEFDIEEVREHKGIRLKSVLTVDKRGLAAMSSSFFAAICCAFGKYDIIHFHAEGPAFMCWLPKLFGKRVVVTIHGLDHQRGKWGKLASAYIMAGERNAVKYADQVIVLSENIRQYFKSTYGRDTECIPNGVGRPKKRGAQLIRERYQLEANSYILFLGRIVPEKGLRYLLKAFQNIQTEKKLVVAGGSSDTDSFLTELKEMAKADPRILFTGFVQGAMLEELYSNAYVYVLPSDLEGMPLSLMEAMSYEACCLVSDISECASVIEDHGVLFRHGDVQHLQNQLQMLCDNPEMVDQYRCEAADFICGKYSWDEMAQKTFRLYRRLHGEEAV